MPTTVANPLRRVRDTRTGECVSGLWANDIVRMERVDNGWKCQAMLRRIGDTSYFEHANHARGGQWHHLGTWRKREHCRRIGEKLLAGTHVWKTAIGVGEDMIYAHLVEWAEVAAEIAAHPSVRGE